MVRLNFYAIPLPIYDVMNDIYLFIYTIFQEGDIFSSTASLPYGPIIP